MKRKPIRIAILATVTTPAELVVALKAAAVVRPAGYQARPATQTETRA